MINPARLKISEHQHILAAGIRLLEQYKLSLGAGKRKKKDTPVNFIEEYIKAGDTVVDIGSKDSHHLHCMHLKLRASGKIIAFLAQPGIYRELIHLK